MREFVTWIYILNYFNFIKKLFYLKNFDWIILLLSFPHLYSFNFLNIFFIELFHCITGYFSIYFSFYLFISLNFIYLFFYYPPHFLYNIFYPYHFVSPFIFHLSLTYFFNFYLTFFIPSPIHLTQKLQLF